MNLFKNKKEEIKAPVEPMPPTETITTGEEMIKAVTGVEEIVAERKNEIAKNFTVEAPKQEEPVVEETPDRFKYYIGKYHNAFSKDDTEEPNLHNLLFGILTEIKELKEVIGINKRK